MSKDQAPESAEPHPNQTRLQKNEEATKANVEAYLENKIPLKTKNSGAGLLQTARSEFKTGNKPDYSRAIEQLKEKMDLERGIVWHKSKTKHPDGSQDLIRDARKATSPPNPNDPNAYAIQLLNVARAAEKLVESEITDPDKKKEAINQIRAQASKALNNLNNNQDIDIDIEKENAQLVKNLKSAGIEDPKKKLAVLKEFGNFEDTHYHISTLSNQTDSKNNTRVMVESDVMMLGLTDLQKAQYNEIAQEASPDANINNFNFKPDEQPVDMSWYNDLPPIVKKAVHANAKKIAEGNHVLPTQLRKEVIGVRNAYSKTTSVTEVPTQNNSSPKLKTVVRTYHMGTPSFHGEKLSEDQNQAVANENINQALSFVDDKGATINVLNSPANPTGIDSAIHQQVGKAAEASKDRVTRATTPFNAWRKYSRNDNSGYKQALEGVGEIAAEQKLNAIANFLKTGKGEKEAREELANLLDNPDQTNKALGGLFSCALEAKVVMQKSHAIIDPDNNNLKLSSAMKQVASEASSEKVKTALKDNPGLLKKIKAIITNCASGKDRTGLVETETSRSAVQKELGVTAGSPKEQKNFQEQINAGHTQTMAGTQGGTNGAYGIKKDSKGAFPNKLYSKVTGLILETASYNKLKASKEKVHHRIMNSLKAFKQKTQTILNSNGEKQPSPSASPNQVAPTQGHSK